MILKHRNLCQFSYSICLITLISVPGTSAVNVRDLNYCSTNGTRWRLVHSYDFTNDPNTTEEWNLQDEYGYCQGNHTNLISCDGINNVQVDSGYVILPVRRLDNFTFTGSTPTSESKMTSGRVEIRIRLNIDDFLRMAIITKPLTTEELHPSSQIGLGIYSFKDLMSGKYAVFSGDPYRQPDNRSNSFELSTDLSPFVGKTDFHLVGMEWTTEQTQFFVNDQYLAPIRIIESDYYLQIWALFNDLKLSCPAVIIDYIRIYKKDNDNSSCNPLPIAENANRKEEQKTIDWICAESEREKILDSDSGNQQIILWLAFGVLIVLCLVVIFMNRIRMMNQTLVQKNNEIKDIKNTKNEHLIDDHLHEEYRDNDNYYEVLDENGEYDDEPAECLYLDVQNADNEYLKILYPSAENTC